MKNLVKTIATYICVCVLFLHSSFSQDQRKADSIKNLLKSKKFKKAEYLQLDLISHYETNPDSALFYANMVIEKASALESKDSRIKALWLGYLAKGNALLFMGNNFEAIEAYLKGLEYANQSNEKGILGKFHITIADTYAVMDNDEFAELYYNKGIEELRKASDSLNLASALLNAGDWLITIKSYEKALAYFEESSIIFKQRNNLIGSAYNLGNIGIVHAEKDNDLLAEQHINEAITILEELEDYYPISVYLTYLADIYVHKDNYSLAFKYAERSLELANNYGLKEQIRDSNLKLFELHEASGNNSKALHHYRDYIIFRDSIRNIEEVQKISNAMNNMTMAKLELESQKRKNQRIVIWSTIGVLFLTALLAYGLFKRHKFVKETNKIIAAEKERSDNLLLNILPEDTAEELKESGRVQAKKYESVTVFFSDFKGFTKYAENLSPELLVETIDHYFSKFDDIVEKYGLEKIKTIGDAYMAAGGLNYDNENHAKHMILAAQEMITFVEQVKHDEGIDSSFDIRVGINTGPVVAGVVGTKKFAYDIWGDTVNIAARMESSSDAGRINISEDTYNIVASESDLNFKYRGELAVKNRGHLKMYFVDHLQESHM